MRMATLGKIGEYCASSEEWPQYIERLEFFLIANKVTDNDLKRATFLSVIGPRTFKLLRNFYYSKQAGRQVIRRLGQSAEGSL